MPSYLMGDEMGCELLSPDPRVLPDRISVYGPSLCRGPVVTRAIHQSILELMLLGLLAIVSSMLLLATPAAATTVTYKMAPHERACFFTEAKQKGEKVAFYFAVQSGGQFDIDFEIMDSRQVVILKATGERQGDYVFAAREPGEFTICFSNTMSTFAEKVIDFDVTSEHETPSVGAKSKLVEAVGVTGVSTNDKSEDLKKSIEKLNEPVKILLNSISTISRNQREFLTTERRSIFVVKAIESRIFWFAIAESLMVVAMSVAQVFAIQTFFSKGGRTRV
ncbi:hypothetical protein BASA62_010432 [Batrachochytrium salamandrivorans]|nr:hypothetical protein BASA62_010432 [Batrachochytrium salamandrivorans]